MDRHLIQHTSLSEQNRKPHHAGAVHDLIRCVNCSDRSALTCSTNGEHAFSAIHSSFTDRPCPSV